jgi:hypothetical protein
MATGMPAKKLANKIALRDACVGPSFRMLG